VAAEILGEVKGEKLVVFKFKRRKGYRRKMGHRQRYLRVKITDINS
jgi:large subunit ribosomal protein L21